MALKPASPPPVDQPLLPDLPTLVAIQATYRGEADANQQRRAMDWIVKRAAGIGAASFRADAQATAFMEGRRFVGIQLMALLDLNPQALKQGNA